MGRAPQTAGQNPEGNIVFHVDKDHFKDFVSGVLGKPQSLKRTIYGAFVIDIDWLLQTNNLITQRVQQQNKCHLSDFSCEVFLDDGVVRQLNSIEELESYNEVKNLRSIAIKMNWVFLIQFEGKNVPEKEEVEVFVCDSNFSSDFLPSTSSEGVVININRSGFVGFKIDYTERTWGDDIENLLRNHIDQRVEKRSSFQKSLERWSFYISPLVVIMAFIIPGILKNNYISNYIVSYRDISGMDLNRGGFYIYENMMYMLHASNSQVMEVVTVVMAFLLCFSVISLFSMTRKSFLVITNASINYKKKEGRPGKEKVLSVCVGGNNKYYCFCCRELCILLCFWGVTARGP